MARHQRDAGRPYDRLPSAPPLTVRSDDVADGSQMPMAQVHEGAGGDNRSMNGRSADHTPPSATPARAATM